MKLNESNKGKKKNTRGLKLTVNTESRLKVKNILYTNREIMHLCQVNKIEQYLLETGHAPGDLPGGPFVVPEP